MNHNDHQSESISDVSFSATLTPYRSLSRYAFGLLMTVVATVCLVAGLYFLYLGAWPVFGFLGVDIVLIYWAFKANFAAANQCETVQVTSTRLIIQRIKAAHVTETLEFPRGWVRLELHKDTELEVAGPLQIWFKGKCHEIGNFLNPADREDFAQALKVALYSRI